MIIAFIFTIYFCRCCKWGHDTNDIFKDVDKEIVVNYKEAIPDKAIAANGKAFKINLQCLWQVWCGVVHSGFELWFREKKVPHIRPSPSLTTIFSELEIKKI